MPKNTWQDLIDDKDFFYLTKPMTKEELLAILKAVHSVMTRPGFGEVGIQIKGKRIELISMTTTIKPGVGGKQKLGNGDLSNAGGQQHEFLSQCGESRE